MKVFEIEEVYTDGTKIEANANKYTFVWRKAITTNKEKTKKQLAHIWEYAQSVATAEDGLPDPPDFTTISKEKSRIQSISSIAERLPLLQQLFNGLVKLGGAFR